MTKAEAQRRVKLIRDMRADPVAATGLEDAFHVDVLKAISTGETDDAKGLARVALQSLRIKFPRRGT